MKKQHGISSPIGVRLFQLSEIGVKKSVTGVKKAAIGVKMLNSSMTGVKQSKIGVKGVKQPIEYLDYRCIMMFLGILFLICWVMAFCDLIGFDNWQ